MCDWEIASAWRKYRAEWDAVELKEYEKEYDGDDGDDADAPAYLKRPEGKGRTNLEPWMEAMDWSNLHTLHLGWPSKATLDRLRDSAFPALRHLSINAASGWLPTRRDPFLRDERNNEPSSRTLAPEHGCRVRRQTHPNPYILNEPHTRTETFLLRRWWREHFLLKQSKLSLLLTKSPKLEHLDLNVPRDFNLSPNICGLLNDILSTPTLNHLTLRFPTPDEHFNAPGISYYEYEEAWSQITNKSSDIYHEVDPLI